MSEPELLSAVKMNDSVAFEQAFFQPLLQRYGKNEDTLLHIALRETNEDVANMMIGFQSLEVVKEDQMMHMTETQKELLHVRNKDGDSPLHVAFQHCSARLLTSWQKIRAVRDQVDRDFESMLITAILRNREEQIDMFQHALWPYFRRDRSEKIDNCEALHLACRIGCAKVVKALLLEGGANPLLKDKTQMYPIDYVIMTSNYDQAMRERIGRMVLRASVTDNDAVSEVTYLSGRSLLHCASFLGDVQCVNRILTSTSSVNFVNRLDQYKRTPLHLACWSKSKKAPEIVRLLLSNRANANMVDALGDTPFHIACRVGNCAAAKAVLCATGIKQINARNKEDVTPLLAAAEADADVDVLFCILQRTGGTALSNLLENEHGSVPEELSPTNSHAFVEKERNGNGADSNGSREIIPDSKLQSSLAMQSNNAVPEQKTLEPGREAEEASTDEEISGVSKKQITRGDDSSVVHPNNDETKVAEEEEPEGEECSAIVADKCDETKRVNGDEEQGQPKRIAESNSPEERPSKKSRED